MSNSLELLDKIEELREALLNYSGINQSKVHIHCNELAAQVAETMSMEELNEYATKMGWEIDISQMRLWIAEKIFEGLRRRGKA